MEYIKINGKIIASLQAALHFLNQESEKDDELIKILNQHVEKRQQKFYESLNEQRENLEKVDEYADRIRQKLKNS